MSRYAGRRGRVYLGIANSAASASPLPFVAAWTVNLGNEKIDVTCMGDDGKTFVGGMAEQSGEWSGFHDDSTNQSYAAAMDGLARRFYLYPDTTSTTRYFFGTVICDMSINSTVAGAVEMEASWAAASTITLVG